MKRINLGLAIMVFLCLLIVFPVSTRAEYYILDIVGDDTVIIIDNIEPIPFEPSMFVPFIDSFVADEASLRLAINNAPSGILYEITVLSSFTVNAPLIITNGRNIRIIGSSGITITSNFTSNRGLFEVNVNSRLELSNISLVNAAPIQVTADSGGGNAILAVGANANIELNNTNIQGFFDGVRAFHANSNIIIRDSIVSDFHRNGVGIGGAGSNLDIRNSTVRNSVNGPGIRIVLGSNAYINNVNILDNTFTVGSDSNGAGILISSNLSNVVITNSLISGNTATSGGGIRTISNNLTLNNVDIIGNNATLNQWVRGGGMYIDGGTVTINGGSISNNIASNGGAIHMPNNDTTLTLNNVAINGNTATGTTGGVLLGGARVQFEMNGGSITNNTALTGIAGGVLINGVNTNFTVIGGAISNNSTPLYGGGIAVATIATGVTIEIRDSEISHNVSSTRSGGGIRVIGATLEIHNSRIEDNEAGLNGGGIDIQRGTTLITNSRITENNTYFSGGGIHNSGGVITLYDVEIVGNESTGPTGQGGGLTIGANGRVYMTRGGITHNRGHAIAGGVDILANGSLVTNDVLIYENHTDLRDGGGIFIRGANARFEMNGGSISNNRARNGAGIYMYVPTAEFIMNGGTMTHNHARLRGGGIDMRNGFVLINDATLSSNTALLEGGAIYAISGRLHLGLTDPVTISGNFATVGGGLFVGFGVNFNIERGSVAFNEAVDLGGGIFLGTIEDSRVPRLNIGADVTFSGNQASHSTPTRNPALDAFYYNIVFATMWTFPQTQGFNNLDIYATAMAVPPTNMIEFIYIDARTGTPLGITSMLDTPFNPITDLPMTIPDILLPEWSLIGVIIHIEGFPDPFPFLYYIPRYFMINGVRHYVDGDIIVEVLFMQ